MPFPSINSPSAPPLENRSALWGLNLSCDGWWSLTPALGSSPFCSDSFLGLLGHSPVPGALPESLWEEMWEPNSFRLLQSLLQECEEHQALRECTLKANHLEGKQLTLKVKILFVEGSSQTSSSFLGLIFDATEQVRLKRELMQKRRLLEFCALENERLMSDISHDFKGPLVTSQNFLEVLEGALEEKNHRDMLQALERLKRSHLRFEYLIKKLLSFCQAELQEGQFQEVSLIRPLQRLLWGHRSFLSSEDSLELVGPIPTVVGDLKMLIQVFNNLIDNALTHGRRKRKALRVEIGHRGDAHFHYFFVRDNGPGVAEDSLLSIFERYCPSAPPRTYAGVGLTEAQMIVEKHRGKIWVNSERGQGATFWFSIHKYLPIEFLCEEKAYPGPGGEDEV